VAASSGASLADWSKAWLETAGPNTLRSDFEVDANGAFRSFAICQEAPASHPTLRPHHLGVGLYNYAGGALVRTHQVEIDIAGARTEIPELAGAQQPELILLNDGDLDYAIIRFDPRSMSTLSGAIAHITDSLARAVCWSAAIDMLRQAEMSLPAFASMLTAGLGDEPSLSLLQILLAVTDQQMMLAGDPHWVPEGKQQLAAAGRRLLQAAEPGGDHQLAWAQLVSWTATTPEQLDLLAGLLDGTTEVPGLTVGAELRWAMLRRLAATGRARDAEIEAELRLDATDAGARHATACDAAIPDAGHKAAAWHLMAETDVLGVVGIRETARAFMQPEHASLLAPYAERYFEMLPAIWSSRGEHLRVTLAQLLFPHPAASARLLQQIDAFLTAGERDAGLVRVLTERRDIVERALRSRARPAQAG
jgi:aminopeptidase N